MKQHGVKDEGLTLDFLTTAKVEQHTAATATPTPRRPFCSPAIAVKDQQLFGTG